jgi:hypothetical protein
MTRTRIRIALATTAVGIVAALSLAACGLAGRGDSAGSDGTAADGARSGGVTLVSAEGQALAQMGFDVKDLAAVDQSMALDDPLADPTASPGPSGAPGKRGPGKHPRRPGRVFLAKNVLHGEAVVQTDTGIRTIDVQRGTVTAITDKTVTVKSADGFTQTWTFGTPIHVVEHRTSVQPSAIAVGTEIGLAGTKEGGTLTARLIVVPAKK